MTASSAVPYRQTPERCALCRRVIESPTEPCPEDPLGERPCNVDLEAFLRPREQCPDLKGGQPCFLCGMPIPDKPELFICPKHSRGGWCFDEERARRAGLIK
jgi:hypothetical protein